MSASRNHAVFVANVPPEWRPVGAHTMPTAILGGRFITRRLSMRDALTVARVWNLDHLPCRGTFDHQWAVVIRAAKPNKKSTQRMPMQGDAA